MYRDDEVAREAAKDARIVNLESENQQLREMIAQMRAYAEAAA